MSQSFKLLKQRTLFCLQNFYLSIFHSKQSSFSSTFWPVTKSSSALLEFISVAFQLPNFSILLNQHQATKHSQCFCCSFCLPHTQEIFFFHFCNHFSSTLADYCQLQRRNTFHVLLDFFFPKKEFLCQRTFPYTQGTFVSFSST